MISNNHLKQYLIIFLAATLASFTVEFESNPPDPFFDVGYLRRFNQEIINANNNPVPNLIYEVINDLQKTNKPQFKRRLSEKFGIPSWEDALTFTSSSGEIGLIPLAKVDGTQISAVLIVAKGEKKIRYGVADLNKLSAFKNKIAPNAPGYKDIVALFIVFNHNLFGKVNCTLLNMLTEEENLNLISARSCDYTVYEIQECWDIYVNDRYSYTDCSTSYEWDYVCDYDNDDGNDSGGGGYDEDGSSGGNGNGSGTNPNPCNLNLPCQYTTETIIAGNYLGACYIYFTVSGCDFGSCSTSVGSTGLNGCGHSAFSTYNISNTDCASYLSQIISSDPSCRVSTVCGDAYFEYDIIVEFPGGFNYSSTGNEYNFYTCYECINC